MTLLNRSAVKLASLCGAALVAFVTPAIAQVISAPEIVETAQLPEDAFSIGALEPGEGALPASLWTGSQPHILEFLLNHAPTKPQTPAMGEAMRRVLLSPGEKPAGADSALGGKKLLALTRAGFLEEARTIASLATTGRSDVYFAEAVATGALLSGEFDSACRRGANLPAGREALFWVKLRALCYARAGEFDAFDLTVNILRERGAFTNVDEAYLLAALSGANGGNVQGPLPPVVTPLHFAAAKIAGAPVYLAAGKAEGGVIAAVAADGEASALQLEAAQKAVSMGVLPAGRLRNIMNGVSYEVTDIAAASDLAASAPDNPMIDALLYQSIAAMNAPEFIRDKAARISQALELADSFHRAYALSVLYADDIASLEGVLVAPEEASSFARARMAVGDSVGAARWLSAMIGANESVAALPENLGLAFIDNVNLLALLDPQAAALTARQAGVSLLAESMPTQNAHDDPAVTARILEAAFDAVSEGKAGQAGLVALAASSGKGDGVGEVEAVIINEALASAGLAELQRRHAFEQAWGAKYQTKLAPASDHAAGVEGGTNGSDAAMTATPASAIVPPEERGFAPRLKPARGE